MIYQKLVFVNIFVALFKYFNLRHVSIDIDDILLPLTLDLFRMAIL